VRAAERKRGYFVIETAGCPAYLAVTLSAVGRFAAAVELTFMNILMTAHAAARRTAQRDLPPVQVFATRLMTVHAGQRTVGARQFISGCGMIEGIQLPPGSKAVTCLAQVLAGLKRRLETRVELAAVRVPVAFRAA
jgi:hypothetical protein